MLAQTAFRYGPMSRGEPDCSATPLLADELTRPRRLRRLGNTRAHTCHLVERACLWRRRVWLESEVPAALAKMKVRMVHVGFQLSRVSELDIFRAGINGTGPLSYSRCVPLMWWPLWGYNIGEFFQSSVLPIAELIASRAIGSDLLLAPEVGGWPLMEYHRLMLGAFSTHPIRSTGMLAPKCGKGKQNAASECPPPRCFEKMLVCKFRDVYDGEPPIAPWSAARRIVQSLDPRPPPPSVPEDNAAGGGSLRAPPFVVLFASRGHAKNGARMLRNEAELLRACQNWRPPPGCVRSGSSSESQASPAISCEARVFGKRGFRSDVLAVQKADVLIGTHGAALVHAIFMRKGSSLIEIRPYGFDGSWPDQYHYSMARRQNATHAFVIRTTDRTLCEPIPLANVTAWDARPLNTFVKPQAFERALAAAACARGGGPGVAREARVPSPAAVRPFLYGGLASAVIENG